MMKSGIIDVGGGMRGAYAAGIQDFLMDKGVVFDSYMGISAGASNLICYLSGQKGRLLRFYRDYAQRKEYLSFSNYLKNGAVLDFHYIFHTLSDPEGEDPFDIDAFQANPAPFTVVATRADTAEAVYFDSHKEVEDGGIDFLAASANLPGVDKAYYYKGIPYFDGALSDPIPYEKLFAEGMDRVVVILTRPIEKRRDPKSDRLYVRMISHKWPEASKALAARAELYNSQIDRMQRYIDEGRLFVISPDDTCGVTTLKHRSEDVTRLYEKGYADGEKVLEYLSSSRAE